MQFVKLSCLAAILAVLFCACATKNESSARSIDRIYNGVPGITHM